MTDAWDYTDPSLGPRSASAAQAGALTSLDENPDEAARAYHLSKDTGIPAEAIHGNLEESENQYKGALVGHLLKNNKYLQDYVNSHPLAGAISNDDYGQLDKISQALGKIGPIGVMQEAVKGFKEHYDTGDLGSYISDKDWEEHPIASTAVTIAGTGFEVGGRILSAGLAGLHAGTVKGLQQFGMEESSAERLARDITGEFERRVQSGEGLHGAQEHVAAAKAAEPYVKAGDVPPVGLDPIIDKFHEDQAKADLKALDEVHKEVQASTTYERAPDLTKAFIQQHIGQAKIGITADEVARLYGEKQPHPEDGILGFVPDLASQLKVALASGGDVEVPLADWLAHVDPEVAKELHDHLRLRKGGMTLEESKVISQQLMVEAKHASPHDFDAFSMDKIGTGEGAQSYGHGLYFSTNEGVHQEYLESLGGRGTEYGNAEATASLYLNRATSREVAIANLKTRIAAMFADPGQKGQSERLGYDGAIKLLESGWEPPKANSYRVRIHADKEHFLDWDKPFSEQDPHVQKAVQPFLEESLARQAKAKSDLLSRGVDAFGKPFSEKRLGQLNTPSAKLEDMTGEEIHRRMGLPAMNQSEGFQQSAKALREAGIPGIKYLDQGSRNAQLALAKSSHPEDLIAPEPTHNFVLFDDSLIEITHKNDQAVASVRKAAGLEPKLDVPKGWDTIEPEVKDDFGGRPTETLELGRVKVVVPKKFTPEEMQIIDVVHRELGRIVPKAVEATPALETSIGNKQVRGSYTMFKERLPVISWALDINDPVGIARHEAIHHLRQMNFFTEGEWKTLADTADAEGWIDKKRGIDLSVRDRYSYLPKEGQLEEAIAEEFRYWKRDPKAEGIIGKVFEKLREYLTRLQDQFEALRSKSPAVDAIFSAVERGEVGSREGAKPIIKGAFEPKAAEGQPELPGMTRQEDLSTFKPSAVGLTGRQMQKVMDLIAELNKEDQAYQQRKIEKLERAKQTTEWKEHEAEMRDEVENDLASRPDIALSNFLRSGLLYGESTGRRPRIDPRQLTPEQRAAFPEKYTRRDGMAPSDIANLFGYPSVDAMVAGVAKLEGDMATAGETRLGEFTRKLAAAETDRRMVEKYGDLEENILREAQEHVVSPTQMDLLHEETVALGMQNGWEMPFTKEEVKAGTKEAFGEMPASSVSMEKFLKSSGKAGKLAQLALLEGNATEFFKQRQAQEFSLRYADEAKKFARLKATNERLVKRYARQANITSVAQEYTDQVHQFLRSVGIGIRRSPENIGLSTKGKSLVDFIAEKNAAGDGMLDPGLPMGKTVDQFSVAEYTDFSKALKSIDFNGKQDKIIQVGNEKLERADAVSGVVESLDPLKKFDMKEAPPKGLVRRFGREVDARLIKVEQLADWIDHNDPRGWFNQTVVRPLYEAQHIRGDTIAELAKDVKAIPVDRAWGRALNDRAENTILRDASGKVIDLTNENKIAIALNMGNESNKSVLLRGHEWLEQDVVKFLQDKMTDMDWAFVEGMWRIFDKIAPFVTDATTKRTGVPIEMVQPSEILGRKGGYYPLTKDSIEALLGRQVETDLVDKPFFDPLPMARALKLRTGTAYPLDLSLTNIASRINETLHAALFQDPIRNARKVTSNESVRRGIAEAFGPEFVKQIDVWLKDIANNGGETFDPQAAWTSRNLRENVVYGLMGYKVSTAAIHALSAGVASGYEVGPIHLAKNLKDLGIAQIMPDVARRFFANEKQMWEQVDWAHKNFPELRNRMQDIGRDMQAQMAGIVNKGFLDDAARIRATNIVWSMKMVATLDQLTATPVAMAAYRKAIAEGWSHADAVYAGDKAVRTAHGSPSLVGRANIGRGETGKWLTIAYNGYWNHNYNRTRSAIRDVKAPDVEFTDRLMIGSAALTAFIIAPAIIHYAIRGSDSNNFAEATSEALLSQFGGQIPIVNTLTHSFMHNRDPHVSPFDELLNKVYSVKRDAWNLAQGKKAEHFLRHVVETPGYLAGIGASNQLGAVMEFNKDVMQNKQRPKSILDWARGEITGEMKSKVKKR